DVHRAPLEAVRVVRDALADEDGAQPHALIPERKEPRLEAEVLAPAPEGVVRRARELEGSRGALGLAPAAGVRPERARGQPPRGRGRRPAPRGGGAGPRRVGPPTLLGAAGPRGSPTPARGRRADPPGTLAATTGSASRRGAR